MCMCWSGERSKEVPVTAEKADPETSTRSLGRGVGGISCSRVHHLTGSPSVQKIQHCFLLTGPPLLSVECLGPAVLVHSALGLKSRPVS